MSYSEMLRLLLPRYCVLCNTQVNREINLCEECYAGLPRIEFGCDRCGTTLSVAQDLCATCLQDPTPFDRTITVFEYRRPIDYLITSLKFADNLACAEILGRLLVEKLHNEYQGKKFPEAIIPVPLHQSRLEERGFNQTIEIAKPISKHLRIPIDNLSCSRKKETRAQVMLQANDRSENVKEAFIFDSKKQYQHVAVLDDVITTGSTITEVCHAIRKAGVQRIDVWSCARASSITNY